MNTGAVDPVDPRWYETFFEGDEWLLLATTRDPERTALEVEFVASRIPAGARVLDVPCGTGRIAVPLAERGFLVSGLDISETVLAHARAAAPELDLRQGDMRELPWPDGSFDAALNLWTAFGYFESQQEDERVLAEVARVLAPGGVFVLDTVNQTALLRGFRPQAFEELDGTVLLQEHAHDSITGRSQARWTFLRDGRRAELSFDHRVYTTPEYVAMLGRAGLQPSGFFGGFDGQDLGWDTWRQIIVSRKP
jgi:SAM-dependent methyltransferase